MKNMGERKKASKLPFGRLLGDQLRSWQGAELSAPGLHFQRLTKAVLVSRQVLGVHSTSVIPRHSEGFVDLMGCPNITTLPMYCTMYLNDRGGSHHHQRLAGNVVTTVPDRRP